MSLIPMLYAQAILAFYSTKVGTRDLSTRTTCPVIACFHLFLSFLPPKCFFESYESRLHISKLCPLYIQNCPLSHSSMQYRLSEAFWEGVSRTTGQKQ